ncbi:MAG: PBP1A family penicillin-binding protein [Candidatus Aquicultor sp.]|nr:PBP1A family penicillin-binding protein [Candidatus Aquicultor sp.]
MGCIFSRKFLATIMVMFVLTGIAGGIFVYEATRDLPDIGDVKSVIKTQTTHIYAADGTLITRLFQENRTIVPLKDISPTIQKAVISVEDQRYYQHRGVDYIRIIGALIKDVRQMDTAQGGSTITQQYVKNAYFSPEKTVSRKLREAFLATKLERTYKKEEILEKYLNTIYFGSGAYGIEAAAQSYFGVPASKLNLEQSALLAGMIKAPESYNPYKNPEGAVKRRDLVIGLMIDQGYADEKEAGIAKERPLALQPRQRSYQGIAPYFTEWVKTELKELGYDEKAIYSQGFRIHTTLDPKIQESSELAWKKYLPSSTDPDVALVSIEPKSGAVRAMVGGKDFARQKFNIAAQWPGRQPGSAFKPFTLTAALMEGVSPDDGYEASSPKIFKVAGSANWKVHNSSGESGAGYMDLRRATAWSVNVVYAGLIMKIGANNVVKVAKDLGITSKLEANPAITLGGLERGVTPLEMANAYATLANGGKHNKAYGVDKITTAQGELIYKHKAEPEQVVDKAVAYLVTEALRGVIQSGTGRRAAIGRPSAGKTGTSQDYVDAWFCGYTPDLATAVWVGYLREPGDPPKPMKNVHGIRVSGGSFPAQIWAAHMKRALKDVREHSFDKPPRGSFSQIQMCDETNLLSTEWCPKTSYHIFVRKYKPSNVKTCNVHQPIPLPDLIGLTQDEAIKKLTELKLGHTLVNKPFAGPPGQVFEQSPAAGTEVRKEAIIALSISTGGDVITEDGNGTVVPNVIGLAIDTAVDELEARGFVVTGEYRLSNEPQNQVIGQRPPAGFIAEPGANITIVISGESGKVIMPDVRGKSEARARDILESKGFEITTYSDSNKESFEKYGAGNISKQEPKARARIERGAKVVLYVTT